MSNSMSDLISRTALIEDMSKKMEVMQVSKDGLHPISMETVIDYIKDYPTVEAKPVVHCKDCEHWGTGVAGETKHVKCCEYGKYMVGENGYCCYADMRKKVE